MSNKTLRKVTEIQFQDKTGYTVKLDTSKLEDPVYTYYVAWVDVYTLIIELPEFINLRQIMSCCPVEQQTEVLMSFVDREALKQ